MDNDIEVKVGMQPERPELTMPSFEQNQNQAMGPKNADVPVISHRRLEPLVNSFWETMANKDLSQRDSRATVAQLFFEIVTVTCQEILVSIQDYISTLNPAHQPRVSQKTVKKALLSSNCFKMPKCCGGGNEKPAEDLVDMVSVEATDKINKALSKSKVDDKQMAAEKSKCPRHMEALRRCFTCQDHRSREHLAQDIRKPTTMSPENRIQSLDEKNVNSAPTSPVQAKKSCWHGAEQKIKSFLAFCYAEDSFKKLALCCWSENSTKTMEDVLEEASPVLKKLVEVPTEQKEHQRTTQDIRDGQFDELSNRLTEILSETIDEKEQPQMKKTVRARVASFTADIRNWLDTQLSKIRTKASQPQQAQLPPKLSKFSPLPVCSAHPTTSSGAQSENKWKTLHSVGLVYEVMSRIMQSQKIDNLKDASTRLHVKLQTEIAHWDVKVKPDNDKIKDVAKAVYRDLCKGSQKNWMMMGATICEEYSNVIVGHIHKHLVTPPEGKPPTCSAVCGRCTKHPPTPTPSPTHPL